MGEISYRGCKDLLPAPGNRSNETRDREKDLANDRGEKGRKEGKESGGEKKRGGRKERRCVVPARISSQSSHHCWRSPLPNASALIQKDFRSVLGVQQSKQLPRVAKVDLVWQLGV
ncbi:hypothetical protein TNCV_4666631 [Trichonephila clavipes]|nr:hypothetical protein TNCV_4666631 [Trichonephila clavipes]